MRQHLPTAQLTTAEYLKRHGYATAWVGKWHLGGEGFLPTDQGFDLYHPGNANTRPSENEGGKGEYDLTAQAERFIEENRERPFFLCLSHNAPHINYRAKTNLVAQNARAFEPVYAAMIETLDDRVGRLLAKLDRLGLNTNTIVIFTSDNGGLHVPEGQHERVTHNTPFRAGKGFLYEGGLRIPLLVRWPGKIAAGQVLHQPVINTDWLPTLLELAGLSAPAHGLDGVSFAGLLVGKPPPASRAFFWHFPHYTNQGSRPGGAVRDGDWKLVEHYEDGRVELFDLASDPGEATDLAAREPKRAAELRARLAQWRLAVGAQTNTTNPNFNPDPHRGLYIDLDMSRFDPMRATPPEHAAAQLWRKQMDAAVR
jgi:arylsulfatase A-like enzyme